MIVYDKPQWTNHFLSIAEMNFNQNCLLLILPSPNMSEITSNITLQGSNNNRLLRHFSMIAYDKHQCTNHFISIEEIDCNNNCVYFHMIPIVQLCQKSL